MGTFEGTTGSDWNRLLYTSRRNWFLISFHLYSLYEYLQCREHRLQSIMDLLIIDSFEDAFHLRFQSRLAMNAKWVDFLVQSLEYPSFLKLSKISREEGKKVDICFGMCAVFTVLWKRVAPSVVISTCCEGWSPWTRTWQALVMLQLS